MLRASSFPSILEPVQRKVLQDYQDQATQQAQGQKPTTGRVNSYSSRQFR
jgi:hypothetical protein